MDPGEAVSAPPWYGFLCLKLEWKREWAQRRDRGPGTSLHRAHLNLCQALGFVFILVLAPLLVGAAPK